MGGHRLHVFKRGKGGGGGILLPSAFPRSTIAGNISPQPVNIRRDISGRKRRWQGRIFDTCDEIGTARQSPMTSYSEISRRTRSWRLFPSWCGLLGSPEQLLCIRTGTLAQAITNPISATCTPAHLP